MNEGYDPARSSVGELLPINQHCNSRLLYSESKHLSRGVGVSAPPSPSPLLDRPFTESTPLSFVVFALLALPAARPKAQKLQKSLKLLLNFTKHAIFLSTYSI